MIKLVSATLQHGQRAVLRSVSLDIARGATTAVLGPSGCGKSTLLRLIVGLARPSQGSVAIDGHDPCGPARLTVQRRIGYVIQEGGLFPHLTARDNVTLLARHLDWEPARIQARTALLLDTVKLTPDVLERHPQQLSGGQRQRVALMRALMLDPEVLLLDEPLAALDPLVRADLQDELLALFSTLQKTVILVTHDLAEAAHFASTLVLLREGEIVAQGALASLRTATDPFVRRYLSAQRALALPATATAAGP